MSHRNKTTPKQHLRSVTSTPGLQRSGIRKTSTASSPSLRAISTAEINRKASLQALNGRTMPATPSSDGSLDVGDMVNVPGDMYGTVRFIGTVRGKPGRFVGVELDQEFAAKGKNDGDVDGTKYFHTEVPGAGIFLPVHRAERRSPDDSFDSYPGTPSTPSHSTFNGRRTTTKNGYTPPTPALPAKFSQSVGPGARPASPMFKPKRPSLPRPESPLRRQPNLAPTPNPRPGFSQSVRGGRPPVGTTPNKPSFKASTSGRPPTAAAPRPYSRTGSRMGNRADEDAYSQNGRGSNGQSFSQPLRSPSRLGSAHGQESELAKLRAQLADRDRRLEEQANNLAEMESSVKELSALIPTDGSSPGGGRASDYDDKNSAQLRQALREKNEKISILTADFDAHRADFRSTLDSLEMASSETERVYEEQKRDLLAQISELQEMRQNQEDFEGVAEQLKQLEELVAELEEGLEESRRGEAEARGEVEFLRGEVERGRSELRREREKAAAALQDAGGNSPSSKELEAKDDEIRGLKAIIHGLSDGRSTPNTNASSGADNEDVQRLQAALEESRQEREELEREVEQLRRDNASAKMTGQNHARHASELTEKALPMRPRRDTVKAVAPLDEHTVHEQDEEDDHQDEGPASNHNHESEALFCELCKSPEHDTLDCTSLRGPASDSLARDDLAHQQPEPADMPKPLSLGREKEDSPKEPVAEKVKEKAAEKDEDKWCALCEQDGHLAFDCPQEQY